MSCAIYVLNTPFITLSQIAKHVPVLLSCRHLLLQLPEAIITERLNAKYKYFIYL